MFSEIQEAYEAGVERAEEDLEKVALYSKEEYQMMADKDYKSPMPVFAKKLLKTVGMGDIDEITKDNARKVLSKYKNKQRNK